MDVQDVIRIMNSDERVSGEILRKYTQLVPVKKFVLFYMKLFYIIFFCNALIAYLFVVVFTISVRIMQFLIFLLIIIDLIMWLYPLPSYIKHTRKIKDLCTAMEITGWTVCGSSEFFGSSIIDKIFIAFGAVIIGNLLIILIPLQPINYILAIVLGVAFYKGFKYLIIKYSSRHWVVFRLYKGEIEEFTSLIENSQEDSRRLFNGKKSKVYRRGKISITIQCCSKWIPDNYIKITIGGKGEDALKTASKIARKLDEFSAGRGIAN